MTTTDKKPSTFSEITQEQIAGWKSIYGDRLSQIDVRGKASAEELKVNPNAKGTVIARFIVVPPNRTVLDVLGTHRANNDVAAGNRTIISNCVLGGDLDEMEKNGMVYTEVLNGVRNSVEAVESEIKKI